ncbi:cation efflux system protein [Bacteroidia bacterium]|nr:cation efflux system protein [Bacteroidia bacterium]
MAVYSLTFTACHHTHEGHSHDAAHEHDEHQDEEAHENIDAIHFETEQQEKIVFAVEHPAIETFGQVIKTTAQIQSSQADEAIIASGTSGIVIFPQGNLTEGKPVNPNQPLFTVSGAGLADNNSNVRFTEAQTNFRKAESDYKRAQGLIQEKIISEKDFLQIQSDYETAKAVYDNLYKNFSSGGQTVSAPFAGYIKQVLVENGQFVEEGSPLAVVSKNKSLILKADVSPKYAALLPYLSSATVRGMDKITYSLEELNGKILSFGKSLNSDNYLIPVSLQIDNKAGFLSGGFVEVSLKTQSGNPVMTVPVSALTEDQGIFFVYVQLNPESFEKREVTIGVTDGIRTEILSGLNKDERIVTKGAISVKLAQSTGALDPHAGHVH